MDGDLLWGSALTMGVLAVLGAWFHACGRAGKERRVRPFAWATLRYAGIGFVLGAAFLTSDLGTSPPEGRLGLIAFTVCCFLLLYAGAAALTAADDRTPVLVNLTGRALLLSDPDLAPFYTLPAPQETPASELPPPRPYTHYIVTAELARAGAESGRADLLMVDPATTIDAGDHGPLRVRRLLRATPAEHGGIAGV